MPHLGGITGACACAHANARAGEGVAIASINGAYATIVKTENLKNHLRNIEKESKRLPRLLQEKFSSSRSRLRPVNLCILNNVPQEIVIP